MNQNNCGKFISVLFRFKYSNSEDQEAWCEKHLDFKNRTSIGDGKCMGAKWVYKKLDHLRRFHRSGRETSNAYKIFSSENILLSRIKKNFSFAGKTMGDICGTK